MIGFRYSSGIPRGQREQIMEMLESEGGGNKPKKKRHGSKITIPIPLWIFLIPIALIVIAVLYIIMSMSVEAGTIVDLYNQVDTYTTNGFDSKRNFNRPIKYLIVKEDGSVEIVVELSNDYLAKYSNETDDSGGLGGGDTNDDTPETPIGPTGQEAADAIIKALQNKGYNNYAIAAAIGNFMGESGCNPITTQNHTHDGASNEECVSRGCTGNGGGNAHGFAQWDGGRRAGLITGAMQSNIQWYSFDYQLGYFLAELNSNNCSVEKFNENATDLEHAVYWFAHKFERCGISKSCPGYDSKKKYCASQVSFDEREYINGWSHRLEAAKGVLGQ